MDFGDILDEWDKIKERDESRDPRKAEKPEASEAWLDAKGIDEGASPELDAKDRARETRRIAAMKPQATLDLHGMTAEEAQSAIGAFLGASAREGLEKVLVIHGKGMHSEGGRSVLRKVARQALEAHPAAGRIGEASRSEGGSGALWVAIKKRTAT